MIVQPKIITISVSANSYSRPSVVGLGQDGLPYLWCSSTKSWVLM